MNPYFQINLDVAERSCLVVGGGDEATEKSDRLLDAGARLTLVSPRITPRLQESARDGKLRYFQRRFRFEDLDDVFLVVNTARSNPELTRQVFETACARGILINSYDQPAFSNFGMVALVHPGHLRLSISTSNASPSLASRLRQDLEALFDEEFVDYLEQLARVRQHLKAREPDREKRIERLRSLVATFRLEGRLHYPENWREQVETLLTQDLE
jgi:precorrin-2 dehydrogenase/sirohydrochlorin ferrochelatase